MARYAIDQDRSIFDAMNDLVFMGLSGKAANSAEQFYAMIKGFTQMQEYLSVTEIVEQVIDKSGYRAMLQNEKQLKQKAV